MSAFHARLSLENETVEDLAEYYASFGTRMLHTNPITYTSDMPEMRITAEDIKKETLAGGD